MIRKPVFVILSCILTLGLAISVTNSQSRTVYIEDFWVAPTVNFYLSELETNPSLSRIVLVNSDSDPVDIIMRFDLSGPANAWVEMKPLSLPPGEHSYTFVDIRQMKVHKHKYDKAFEKTVIKTNRLPPGTYTLTLTIKSVLAKVLSPRPPGEVIESKSIRIRITNPSPPKLIYPIRGISISERFPTFRWLPSNVPPNFQEFSRKV